MCRALSVICIDEKKEPVLDCYVSGYARSSMSIHRCCSGAQSETLFNLVNSSMLSLATNVGAEEETYQMLCAVKETYQGTIGMLLRWEGGRIESAMRYIYAVL